VSDVCYHIGQLQPSASWVLLCMTIARRFIVRGRVQGVGFRYFAVRAARQAGVTGTVRNLADGTVEAIAEGTPNAIDQFRSSLQAGPSYGHVSKLDETELQPIGYSEFEVSF
jgi:acylphosphatase